MNRPGRNGLPDQGVNLMKGTHKIDLTRGIFFVFQPVFLLQLCDHAPKWLQGVAYHDGSLYLTSDDGDADAGEPDHMFRVIMSSDRSSGKVVPEKPLMT